MAAKPGPSQGVVAQNRRARHDYDIVDTYEAGIVLVGSEVKSFREGKVQLRDSFARAHDDELWLHGMHVAPYGYASAFGMFDPDRARKLLLHRREINELIKETRQGALTLVPLSAYFKDGRAKVELALARGRREYDKRHAIADREAQMEAKRAAGTRRG
jgi:SsrA-binding protein